MSNTQEKTTIDLNNLEDSKQLDQVYDDVKGLIYKYTKPPLLKNQVEYKEIHNEKHYNIAVDEKLDIFTYNDDDVIMNCHMDLNSDEIFTNQQFYIDDVGGQKYIDIHKNKIYRIESDGRDHSSSRVIQYEQGEIVNQLNLNNHQINWYKFIENNLYLMISQNSFNAIFSHEYCKKIYKINLDDFKCALVNIVIFQQHPNFGLKHLDIDLNGNVYLIANQQLYIYYTDISIDDYKCINLDIDVIYPYIRLNNTEEYLVAYQSNKLYVLDLNGNLLKTHNIEMDHGHNYELRGFELRFDTNDNLYISNYKKIYKIC